MFLEVNVINVFTLDDKLKVALMLSRAVADDLSITTCITTSILKDGENGKLPTLEEKEVEYGIAN